MDEILLVLSEPFAPEHITWKPGAFSKDKKKALGMAYADLRAYQNRLDRVLGLRWSVSYTPWGDRVICHLTIDGVTRSSTGEPDSQSERSEIAGTATEAQAFKRAAAMFGLGRYLYELPAIWAEWSEEDRSFAKAGQAKLDKAIADHYKAFQMQRPEQPEEKFMADGPEVKVFMWPTDEAQLGMVAASGENPWVPEDARRLMGYFRKLHADSRYKLTTANTDGGAGQYGYLAGLLDKRYGKPAHRAILSLLCDAVVTQDTPPGGDVRVLIDWLKEPNHNQVKLATLDELVNAFKEEWSKL